MATQFCLSVQVAEEKVETLECRDTEAVLLSLSLAENAQKRLVDVHPETLDKIPSPNKKTISHHTTQIQLAVNDLLKATDPLPITDPLLRNQLEPMGENMDRLRTIYKKLIEDYLDLILEYYRQFPVREGMSGTPTKNKTFALSPSKGTTEKSAPRQSKHGGTLETRRTISQFQMEIEKKWNSIPSPCIGIAHALVARTPNGKNSNLVITEEERTSLLSKIDHLFPELDQRRKISRSDILDGATVVRNVLQEVPVKRRRKHPPRLSRLKKQKKNTKSHTSPSIELKKPAQLQAKSPGGKTIKDE